MRVGKFYRQEELIISHVWRAEAMLDRMRGLLGRAPLQIGQALLITPCNSIHTLGMKYSLDIVFIDAKGTILKICRNLRSFRMAGCIGAHSIIEFTAGEAERIGLLVGDELQWRFH